MKSTVKIFAFTAVLVTAIAFAQNKTAPQGHSGPAETSLVGVSLFDTGQKLIAKFGSPNEIQGLSLGTAAGGAGGGGGGAAPGGGRSGPGPVGGGKGGAAGSAGDFVGDPFDLGKSAWQVASGASAPGAPSGGGELTPNTPASGGGGGGRQAGVGGGTTQGSSGFVTFTRWVYNKGTSRYAFVLDKFNRVVQIEAFGLWDTRVKTKRGAKFGSSFGTLIKKYNAPDGYELNGDTIVMRYLTRDRVAFRLQKTDPKKGHMVTGIVVAAGK